MANVNISLPEPMLEFIDGLVAPGHFPDRDAVLQAAVADWQQRLGELNSAIQVGLDDFERGDFIEVHDVRAWIETLGNEDG